MARIPLEKKLGFWHGLFESWGRQGLGSKQAYNRYMQMRHEVLPEYRMRYKDFLDAYREFVGIPKKSNAWKYVRKDYRPTERVVVHTMLNPVRNYLYEVNITTFHRETKEIKTHPLRIASDNLISKEEIEEKVRDIIFISDPKKEITNIEHVNIFGRTEYLW